MCWLEETSATISLLSESNLDVGEELFLKGTFPGGGAELRAGAAVSSAGGGWRLVLQKVPSEGS